MSIVTSAPDDSHDQMHSGTNGHPQSEHGEGPDDRRVLAAIVGAIILAFSIGVVILLIAALSDWQS